MDIASPNRGHRSSSGSTRQRGLAAAKSVAGAGPEPRPAPDAAVGADRVRSLLPLLAAAPGAKRRTARALDDRAAMAAEAAPAPAALITFPQRHPATAAPRPLRVLHVVDGTSGGLGRMVISGRMADVCAEIDRLAACEARRMRRC